MKMEIATRLYQRRKASGLSQEQVAALLGVSRQAVSKWECADSSPDTDNLIALSRLYGVSMDDLLFADVTEQETEVAEPEDSQTESIPETDPAASMPETEEAPADTAEDAANADAEANMESEAATNSPKDYVNISLKNGIHVRDAEKGDEVHVGWDGIHVDTADNEHVHIDLTGIMDVLDVIIKNRKPREQGGHANFTNIDDIAESILEARKQNRQNNQ